MKTISSPEYHIFRQRMIVARKAAKLTQATLAQSLNKPQSFVAKYENGERRLDVIEFLLITRVMGIDPCDILREINEELEHTSCGETR